MDDGTGQAEISTDPCARVFFLDFEAGQQCKGLHGSTGLFSVAVDEQTVANPLAGLAPGSVQIYCL